MSGPSQSASRAGGNEQVVDTLTDLLVQGMDNEVENGDCFGVCAKCKESVVGVSSGCTAMDQIWHTACFACHHCAINLQGKPFYCMDGKPYCEDDYLVSTSVVVMISVCSYSYKYPRLLVWE